MSTGCWGRLHRRDLAAADRRRPRTAGHAALVLGALVLLMSLSPGCHMHYFLLALPLIMTFLAFDPSARGDPAGPGLS